MNTTRKTLIIIPAIALAAGLAACSASPQWESDFKGALQAAGNEDCAEFQDGLYDKPAVLGEFLEAFRPGAENGELGEDAKRMFAVIPAGEELRAAEIILEECEDHVFQSAEPTTGVMDGDAEDPLPEPGDTWRQEQEPPVAVGSPLAYEGWSYTVVDADTDGWPQIAAANMYNSAPEGQYVLVRLSLTNNSRAIGSYPYGVRLLGADRVIYQEASVVTPCDAEECPYEAVPGGTLEKDLVFDVPASAIPGATLLVGYDGTQMAIS